LGYVYFHIRLDTNKVFYIGVGSDDEFQRANNTTRTKHWKNVVVKTGYKIEIVFENIPMKLALQKEVEFIALYGRKDLGRGELVNMTNGGEWENGRLDHRGKKKSTGTSSKFVGVFSVGKSWFASIRFGKTTTKFFPTEIEAAEGRDKAALIAYGTDTILNFPEKREDYLREDLQHFFLFFLKKIPTLFRNITYLKDEKKWSICSHSFPEIKNLTLPRLRNETQAAELVDKILFFFRNARKSELNFPENYEKLNRENLEVFFNNRKLKKYAGIYPPRSKGRGWTARWERKEKQFYIGTFQTKEEAYEARKKFIKEYLDAENKLKESL